MIVIPKLVVEDRFAPFFLRWMAGVLDIVNANKILILVEAFESTEIVLLLDGCIIIG
jgi:hypothetical protein